MFRLGFSPPGTMPLSIPPPSPNKHPPTHTHTPPVSAPPQLRLSEGQLRDSQAQVALLDRLIPLEHDLWGGGGRAKTSHTYKEGGV